MQDKSIYVLCKIQVCVCACVHESHIVKVLSSWWFYRQGGLCCILSCLIMDLMGEMCEQMVDDICSSVHLTVDDIVLQGWKSSLMLCSIVGWLVVDVSDSGLLLILTRSLFMAFLELRIHLQWIVIYYGGSFLRTNKLSASNVVWRQKGYFNVQSCFTQFRLIQLQFFVVNLYVSYWEILCYGLYLKCHYVRTFIFNYLTMAFAKAETCSKR